MQYSSSRSAHLCCVGSMMFAHGHPAATDSTERLAQGFFDGFDTGQRPFQGHLIAGVKGTPANGKSTTVNRCVCCY